MAQGMSSITIDNTTFTVIYFSFALFNIIIEYYSLVRRIALVIKLLELYQYSLPLNQLSAVQDSSCAVLSKEVPSLTYKTCFLRYSKIVNFLITLHNSVSFNLRSQKFICQML